MNEYEIIPIDSSFRIELKPRKNFNLTEKQSKRVEALWDQAFVDSQGTLFNGHFFSMASVNKNRMTGDFVDYKYYLAHLLDPTLRVDLPIEAVGVSGITYAGDKILIGKRANFVTQYKDLFETAPSGSIDPSVIQNNSIDYLKAITQELQEETGIHPSQIIEIVPFAMLRNHQEHFIEICMKIYVDPSLQNLSPLLGEYQSSQWMTQTQINEKIKSKASQFVPLTVFLFNSVL